MSRDRILIEACVDSIESALAAQTGGADRVELCDNLIEGGTTPSAGTIAACRARLRIPVFSLIRARGGDFLFSEAEQDAMLRDIAVARDLGADGVVIGALQPDGTVDVDRTRELVEAARPMAVTFHRAFDFCRDSTLALETLIILGVDRVLSAGSAPTAREGASMLATLVRHAAGRIIILAGGSIDETSVRSVVSRTGVKEVHVRATSPLASLMQHRNTKVTIGKAYTPDDYTRMVTNPDRIRQIASVLETVPLKTVKR